MVLENFLIDVDVLWDRAGKELYEKPDARAGRKMRVRVTNKGLVEDLTGYALNLGWRSAIDETKFGLDAFTAVDITKGIFELQYTSGMLTNIGTLVGTLQLVPPAGTPTESNNFMITVKRSGVDVEAIQSETSFTALTTALLQVQNLESTYAPELLSVKQQLADKVGGGVKAEPEDLSATTLGLVTGTGGPINLLSIPQDASVTPIKTTFMRESINLNKGVANDLDITTIGTYYPAAGRYASDLIDINNLRIFSYKIRAITFHDESQTFITYATGQEAMQEIPIPENAVRFRFSVSAADIGEAFICLSENEIVEYLQWFRIR